MVPVVVVDAAGQVAGPVAQVEHSVRLSQLSMRLQIPFVESKVKSVQPLMSLHAVWQSHSESRMAVVKMFPTHLPLSKQSVQSEIKMSAIRSVVQIRALNLVVLIQDKTGKTVILLCAAAKCGTAKSAKATRTGVVLATAIMKVEELPSPDTD